MDFKNKKSNHHYIGALGEEIAKVYLEGRGYKTIAQNYRKKWGEIDIIMSKKNHIHFVEVKTVSARMAKGDPSFAKATEGKQGIGNRDGYRPEDNMHPWKVKRIYRAIESYLEEEKLTPNRLSEGVDWQIDLVAVYVDTDSKEAKVELLENVF